MKFKKLRTNIDRCKASFDVDRRFWLIIAVDILAIILIWGAFHLLSIHTESMVDSVSEIKPFDVNNPFYSVSRVKDAALVQKIHKTFYNYLAIVISLSVLVALLSRTAIYAIIAKTKNVKKILKKLLPFITLWLLFSSAVAYVLQAALYNLFAASLRNSVWSQIGLLVSVALLIPIFLYIVMTPSLLFARNLSWKETITSMYSVLILKIRSFGIPMIFTLVILIAINIFMRLVTWIFGGTAFMITFSIVLILYISWIRLYFNATLDYALPTVNSQKKRKKKSTASKKTKKARKVKKKAKKKPKKR